MICGSRSSKSRLAKAAGAEPFGQMRDEKMHVVLVRNDRNQKKLETFDVRSTFGNCDAEKMYTVLVRSTCRSHNVQTTPVLEHFWKLRCSKSASRCVASARGSAPSQK